MKVKYLPFQPHCFAFGGFDIQMISTLNAVQKAGINASKMDIWSRDIDFDVIHLWGLGPQNFAVIDWAKKAGKLIVATVLMPYHQTLRSKLGYFNRLLEIKKLMHYFRQIDKVIVVNSLQKDVLKKYYGVPASHVEIIPHLVDDKFFETPTFDFPGKYGMKNYILCTGNISPRKNQYNLAVACTNLNLPLVLIGKSLDGEESYGKKIETLAAENSNILWIKELPNASEELAAAYYNCLLYALPSKDETQPISALEAVAMHKPLVLLNRMYAHQKYYSGAILCKSPSVNDIIISLKKSIDSGYPLVNKAILECKDDMAGLLYKNCYLKLRN